MVSQAFVMIGTNRGINDDPEVTSLVRSIKNAKYSIDAQIKELTKIRDSLK